MNIVMLLEMAAGAASDRIAFTDAATGEYLTYGQLYDASRAICRELQRANVHRCSVLDVSNVALPMLLFASGYAGIPYAPLNYRLTDHEIQGLLDRLKPTFLLTDSERVDRFRGQEGIVAHDRRDFLSYVRSDTHEPMSHSMDPDDVGVLLFTSGTTGAPKAAVLRQRHLVSYILSSVEFMSASEDESTLVSVPPYHIAGIASILSSVYAGRKVVQLAHFDAENWVKVARDEQVTNTFLVPTMLSRIVDVLDNQSTADIPRLESLAYGGGKMPLRVIKRAMELFPNTEFTNAYGLTETSSTITVLGPEEHRSAAQSDDPLIQQRLVSVGLALPGIEIEIRDADGQPQPSGEHGEIYVRGEQVSGEYEGRDSTIDSDGWFPTRDAGYLDDEGYLYLDGRADDVIVRGGENLSPGEIEDVLLEHPAVTDAAICGVPSEEWGEAVVGATVCSRDVEVEELQEWVRDRLRSSRIPERIEFWPELPYNETGKLLRREVRQRILSDST